MSRIESRLVWVLVGIIIAGWVVTLTGSLGTADWVARFVAALALTVAAFTPLLRLWERMEQVACFPARIDHETGNRFAVEVFNAGAVKVPVRKVLLYVNNAVSQPMTLLHGDNALLGPQEKATYYVTCDHSNCPVERCRVLVWGTDRVLATLDGEEPIDALSSQGAHLCREIRKEVEASGMKGQD